MANWSCYYTCGSIKGLKGNPCTWWWVEWLKERRLNWYVRVGSILFPWCFRFIVGLRGCNLKACQERIRRPIRCSRSLLSIVFAPACSKVLSWARLWATNRLPVRPLRLILLWRFRRWASFPTISRNLVPQLRLGIFRTILVHTKRLSFWRKDLNLWVPSSRDRTSTLWFR